MWRCPELLTCPPSRILPLSRRVVDPPSLPPSPQVHFDLPALLPPPPLQVHDLQEVPTNVKELLRAEAPKGIGSAPGGIKGAAAASKQGGAAAMMGGQQRKASLASSTSGTRKQ